MRVIQHSDDEKGPRPAAATSLDQLPLVLTIPEAARVLRVSRAAAYEQARIWRDTGGRYGLPVVVVGRCLRVPREALRRLLDPDESRAAG